jgi:hypothetical protein
MAVHILEHFIGTCLQGQMQMRTETLILADKGK